MFFNKKVLLVLAATTISMSLHAIVSGDAVSNRLEKYRNNSILDKFIAASHNVEVNPKALEPRTQRLRAAEGILINNSRNYDLSKNDFKFVQNIVQDDLKALEPQKITIYRYDRYADLLNREYDL